MWLRNKKRASPRHRFADDDDAPNPLLRVNARMVEQKRMSVYRTSAVFVVIALLCAAAALAWFAFTAAREVFFSENPRYTIKTLAIRSDGRLVTPALVKEWTGVNPANHSDEVLAALSAAQGK